MFRRMTPPKQRLERGPSERSNSGLSTGAEYSEDGPELENAIVNKNWSVVKKLVTLGHGMARKHLLHKAVRVHNVPVEIIELLIDKGCNVDESQEGNWTPLHLACKYDAQPGVIEKLLAAGASINSRTSSGETPLFLAIERDSETVVDLLLKSNADVNSARTTDGMTSLMVVMHNHSSPNQTAPWILDLLLKAGADVNATAHDGSTALLVAVQKGCSPSLLETLIKAGADVNRAKKTGETPLFIVAQHDMSPTLAELLIMAGADVNLATVTGETPISIAAQKNVHISMMETLLRAGADVNKPSNSGLTPVFGAVLEGASKQLVTLMLAHGADIKSHQFQRKSALQVAAERGFTHLFPLLDPEHLPTPIQFHKADFTFTFCAMCRKSENVNLTPCATCCLVAYCSEDCRAKHWKVGGHKAVCTVVLSRMGEDEDED